MANYPNSISRGAQSGALSNPTPAVPRPRPKGPGKVIPFPGKSKPKGPRRVPRRNLPSREERIRRGRELKTSPKPGPMGNPETPRVPRNLPTITKPSPSSLWKNNALFGAFMLGWYIGEQLAYWSMDLGPITLNAAYQKRFQGCMETKHYGPGLIQFNGCIRNQAGQTPTVGLAQLGYRMVVGSTVYRHIWDARSVSPGTIVNRGDFQWSVERILEIPKTVPGSNLRPEDIPPLVPQWRPGPVPDAFPTPWPYGKFPELRPMDAPSPWLEPAPLGAPRIKPQSPQMPDVGPYPGGNPWTVPARPEPVKNPRPDPEPEIDPGGWPGLPDSWPPPKVDPGVKPDIIPVPDGLGDVFPDIPFEPVLRPTHQTWPRGKPQQEVRARRNPRKPRKGEKEAPKTMMGSTMGFLWNAVAKITEANDMVNVAYECLPWRVKVAEYQKRGRQPNPAEKLQIIYRNINSFDPACMITGVIKEGLEDMIYATGGKKLGEAARKDKRPIGYEAGGGLSSNRPHNPIGELREAPSWWPEIVPW